MNNLITENEYGIFDETHGAHNNTISKNTITGNRNFGISSDGNNTITSNTIANNGGVDSGGIRARAGDEIKFNLIYGNHTWGMYNDSGVVVNAPHNWWGANDGPSITGSGDKVSANVRYDPWLVINISASHTSIIKGGATSIITADMTKNS